MCSVCGCGSGNTRIEKGGHEHHHHEHHHHGNDHSKNGNEGAVSLHGHGDNELIRIEQDILSKNDRYADLNRKRFLNHSMLALNLVSSPGAGKTTLLEKTVTILKQKGSVGVVEGDQETSNDANRIRALGVPAVQVNTGRGCHLDAHMVGHAVDDLPLDKPGVVFIENVGNLVCPASFDLGESSKVVILSVTEGDDKPLKYPDMFAASDVLLLSKTDLLPHVDFDMSKAIERAHRINSNLKVLQVCARDGSGMDEWINWITDQHRSIVDLTERPADAHAQLEPSVVFDA